MVADAVPNDGPLARFNARFGLGITVAVGSMWAAYLFTALALISLPSAVRSGSLIILISWIAQTFLQLVLLPIIIVGQNVQATASDKRAQSTFDDTEAVLHINQQIQAHMHAQDEAIVAIMGHLGLPRPQPKPGVPSSATTDSSGGAKDATTESDSREHVPSPKPKADG